MHNWLLYSYIFGIFCLLGYFIIQGGLKCIENFIIYLVNTRGKEQADRLLLTLIGVVLLVSWIPLMFLGGK